MMGTHHTRMTKNIAAIATVFLVLLQQGMCQLEDVAIKELLVPSHAPRFTNVNLTCRYESAREPLIIKWSHNNLEFLKYQVNSDEPMTIFEDSAVQVIREQSNGETVVLHEVDLAASGSYTCTVIGEAPKFHQVTMTKNMTVVVVPDKQPRIEGAVPDHYAVGDTVNLTCTAAPSIPAASLAWYINDKEADDEYLEYLPEKTEDGLYVSRLHLNFELAKEDFIKGELTLKCEASIAMLYLASDEHSQQEPPATNKEEQNLPEQITLTTETAGSASVLGGLSNSVVLPVMLLVCVLRH